MPEVIGRTRRLIPMETRVREPANVTGVLTHVGTPHRGIVQWTSNPYGGITIDRYRLDWTYLPDLIGPGRYWEVAMVVAVMGGYGLGHSATHQLMRLPKQQRFGLPEPTEYGSQYVDRDPWGSHTGNPYADGWLVHVYDEERHIQAPFPTMRLIHWLKEHFVGVSTRFALVDDDDSISMEPPSTP